MVYDDLVYQEEAHIFAKHQKSVRTPVHYEMLVAHVEAGDLKQMISAINCMRLKGQKHFFILRFSGAPPYTASD